MCGVVGSGARRSRITSTRRRPARPGLEAQRALAHQDLQAVDDRASPPRAARRSVGAAGPVDEVHHGRVSRRSVIGGQRQVLERGCDARAGPTAVQLTSRSAACAAPRRRGRRARRPARAARSGVRFQTATSAPGLAQRPDDGARAAAGAEHERACARGGGVAAARRCSPGASVLSACDRAVGAEGQRVGGADRARARRVASSASASAASLCGIVTFAPAKPAAPSARDRLGEQLGRDRQQLVAPVAEAERRQRGVVHRRRAAVARPASRGRRGASRALSSVHRRSLPPSCARACVVGRDVALELRVGRARTRARRCRTA